MRGLGPNVRKGVGRNVDRWLSGDVKPRGPRQKDSRPVTVLFTQKDNFFIVHAYGSISPKRARDYGRAYRHLVAEEHVLHVGAGALGVTAVAMVDSLGLNDR